MVSEIAMISIVTGGIDAGKTSYLRERAGNNGSMAWLSVKSPKGYDLLMMPSGLILPLARPGENPDSRYWFPFRRFFFNSIAFEAAESCWSGCDAALPKEFILDELGPLELDGRGFAPLLRMLLDTGIDLVVSVRPSLCSAVPEYFGFSPERIIRL